MVQGLVTRDRADAETLDDHKLLWARSGPLAPDVQVGPNPGKDSNPYTVSNIGGLCSKEAHT